MGHFPNGHPDIKESDTGNGAAHPARRNETLQPVEVGFSCGKNQEVVVAPVAQAEHALGNPRQKSQHDPYLQAEDNVKNYRQF